jgi:hypothetical protein
LKLNKHEDGVRPAPENKVFLDSKLAQQGVNVDKRSQLVQVPIDEIAAIGIKASPTYELDDI